MQAQSLYGTVLALKDAPLSETLASGTGALAGAATTLVTGRTAQGIGAVTGAALAGPMGAAIGMSVAQPVAKTVAPYVSDQAEDAVSAQVHRLAKPPGDMHNDQGQRWEPNGSVANCRGSKKTRNFI